MALQEEKTPDGITPEESECIQQAFMHSLGIVNGHEFNRTLKILYIHVCA